MDFDLKSMLLGACWGVITWLWIYRPLLFIADLVAIVFLGKPETAPKWITPLPEYYTLLRWIALGAVLGFWWRG